MKDQRQNAAVASENDWSLGVDSYTHFTRIGKGYYAWGVNVVNRGGMLQTRPGKALVFSLPMKGLPQGICIFRPTASFGNECIIWAMGGSLYLSRYPFTTYALVTGLTFNANAPMVRFCAAKKVSALAADGTLSIVSQPYNVLIVQDGVTAAGVMDGSGPHGYHIYGGAPGFGTPLGLHMCWSGNRLWVAFEDRVFASDFLDPLTFSDSTYLATADNFQLPYNCTGMIETPDERTLLCFTDQAIVSFQSQIADRTMWQNVTDFQKIIVPGTGSFAPRSIFNQYGTTWFYSEFGLTNIDMATSNATTDKIPPKDIEMIRSKDNLSSDISGICGAVFENFSLISVPSGSVNNRHTWVIDAAPQSRLGQIQNALFSQSGVASWAGVWTGTYPIEYTTDIVQGDKRCFELAYSCTTKDNAHVHIWENFVGQRWDYIDTPILCSVELRCFDFGTDRFKFKYVEVDLAEIWGEVHFEIWYAGIKGQYMPICSKTIEAEIGIFNDDLLITYDDDPNTDTILRSYRTQTRTIRSEEISGTNTESPDHNNCGPESVYAQNVDKGFQFMFRWTGACGIRQIRVYADPFFGEPSIGGCEADETGQENILEEIGYLPAPTLCSVIDLAPPPVVPIYELISTGQPQIQGQYELYWLSSGTPQAPKVVTLLKSYKLNVDVIAGLTFDFSPPLTEMAGTQTFLWLFRYLNGTVTSPAFQTILSNPQGAIVSGIAATHQTSLGINTFYFTVTDVDHSQYTLKDISVPQPITSPSYTIDTTHYRDDSYANLFGTSGYHGVISYPALAIDIWQTLYVYQPGTHNIVSTSLNLRASFIEGTHFKTGDVIDITGLLDLSQYPLLFTVLRRGTVPGAYQSDLWAYAGAANMQLGISASSDVANVVHITPPVSLPGTWVLPPAALSLQVNNVAGTEVEMALSPAGANKTIVGFYWPGWDYSIPPIDPFFAGPCGIEAWDATNNVLQRFTYGVDFGPDGNKSAQQYIDLSALCKAHPTIKLVRFSYFGTATKTIYIDGSSNNPGTFELGEATLVGARYPTDAYIVQANAGTGTGTHAIELVTNIGSYNFAFFVMNVSNQQRYA